ncbi:MAG: hypothetical protein WCT16_02705 [Candidatus Buchananbacteria bacterium]
MKTLRDIMEMIAAEATKLADEEESEQYRGITATVNQEAVKFLADYLKRLPPDNDFLNFYSFFNAKGEEIVASDMYPPLNHPAALDFFFFVCSQQFGFWYGDLDGYVEPLFGTLNGQTVKGSDLLWRLAKKAFDNDPLFFLPINLASLSPKTFAKFLSDDNGPVPFPDWEQRYILATGYGRSFFRTVNRKFESPSDIVKLNPRLPDFIECLSANIVGFSDPLDKKSMLLAMVLANRPEHFLKIEPANPQWRPIVDYHLMRSALRFGLVDLDDDIAEHLSERLWLDAEMEMIIRKAVYDAISQVIALSGRSMAEVDKLMWMARKYCPEMERPRCGYCRLNGLCRQRIKLFQPVLRTDRY